MSSRIIEREQSWCWSVVEDFLTENNYSLRRSSSLDKLLKGTYTGSDKRSMLYQPIVEVEFAPISPEETHVGVSFPSRWALGARRLGLWCLVGFGPILVTLKVRPMDVHWFSIWGVAFMVGAAWLIFAIGKVALAAEAVEKHTGKLERQLWDCLDANGAISHEIAELSHSEFNVLRAVKWESLCVAIVFGVALAGCGLLACFNPVIDTMVLLATGVAFCSALLVSLFFGWIGSSYGLPHRYHWKARLGTAYMGWWLFTCFPIVGIAAFSFARALSFKRFGTLSLSRIEYLILIGMLLGLLVALGIFVLLTFKALQKNSSTKRSRGYFASPSTRYEMISEELAANPTRSAFKLHRFWTWAIFLYLTAGWYVATGYILVILFEAVAGLLGAKWAMAQSWYWPAVVPMGGLGTAFQAALLASLAGTPLVLTVIQAVRGRLSMKWRLSLGQELAKGCAQLGLPEGPLELLKRELEVDKLQVALVPFPEIDVRLERTAIFKESYLLWVSSGARKQLSEREIEALLWHECGHAGLIKRIGREVAAILSPWGPRFLDLTQDLYEQERLADYHAVEKMGTSEPLASALQKLKKQGRPLREKQSKADVDSLAFLSWDAVKTLWSLEWVGYLHPDVDQRLRWLEEKQGRS